MKTQDASKLKDYAYKFEIKKTLDENVEELDGGLINKTYKIKNGEGQFVLQRLSPIFNPRIVSDYSRIERYLRTNGLNVPISIKTKDRQEFYHDGKHVWRAFEYLPHDSISEATPEIAYEAGRMLGKFHTLMYKCAFAPSVELPNFHNAPKTLENLEDSFYNPESFSAKSKRVKEEYLFISRNLPKHFIYERENMEKLTIHGDPKLNNFLFKDGKAIAIIDLDTMMLTSSPLIDIGDALRSWCRKKPSTSEFLPEVFEAGVEGYFSTAPFQYCIPGVKSAMSLLTLELSARYLKDYFEESYFPHNEDKYETLAEQNLTRARRGIEYYKNFNARSK